MDKKYHSKIGKLHKLIPRPSEKENFWRSFIMGMSIEEMKNVDVRTGYPCRSDSSSLPGHCKKSLDIGCSHGDQIISVII